MKLQNIAGSIQATINKYSVLLDVELSVVSDNFVRIAATGDFNELIGIKLPGNTIYHHSHNLQQILRINDPRENELCKKCLVKDICKLKLINIYPIILDSNVLGLIGIQAINDDQKQRILSNAAEFDAVIQNMISGFIINLKNSIKVNSSEMNLLCLEHLFRFINLGIIAIQLDGTVEMINPLAHRQLSISTDLIGRNIMEIAPFFNVQEFLKENREDLKYKIDLNGFHGIFSVDPIYRLTDIVGFILMFAPINNSPVAFFSSQVTTLDDIWGD